MTVTRRPSTVTRALVTLVECVALSWALLYLAEFFGWRLVREAGGGLAGL